MADGRFRDALALLGEAASRDPDNAGVRYQAGMMHALLGDLERASTVLRGVLPGLGEGADDAEEDWRARVAADYGGLVGAADRRRLADLLPLLAGPAPRSAGRKHVLS